jgi:hypothetical protein
VQIAETLNVVKYEPRQGDHHEDDKRDGNEHDGCPTSPTGNGIQIKYMVKYIKIKCVLFLKNKINLFVIEQTSKQTSASPST